MRGRASTNGGVASSSQKGYLSSYEIVQNQCVLLGQQLVQVGELKRDAVSALDDLSGLAEKLDRTLRPVKEATEGLSRGLTSIEKTLRRTAETFDQIEAIRKLQHYIDQGLPRCSTIEVVEEILETKNEEEALEVDAKDTEKVKEYLLAVEKLEASLRFLDDHFGGIDSPRGMRERSRTRDSLVMALTHCEVEFSNRLMFVSQIEQCIQAETKQSDIQTTLEIREDLLQHRRMTMADVVPDSPDRVVLSNKVNYLMQRRKRELRLLNMLAEAILQHRVDSSRNVAESIFSSYADVRATSMSEKINKMMTISLAETLGERLAAQGSLVESDEGALRELLSTRSEDLQQMHWEDIQTHARVWIQYLDHTFSQVMAERNFARKIFMDERDCDTAFALVLKASFDVIVSHAVGIARSRKTPEKVFALLDMLSAWDRERALAETLLGLASTGGVAGDLATKVQDMHVLMMNSVRDTYREFTNAVERDDVGHAKGQSSQSSQSASTPGKKKRHHSKHGIKWTPSKGFRALMNNTDPFDPSSQQSQNTIPENATIHPLTAYLIQYCRRLQQYPNASRVLDRRSNSARHSIDSNDDGAVGRFIGKLLNILLKNLKIKVQRLSLSASSRISLSDQDKQAFVDLFMLNNGNYILKSALSFEHCHGLEKTGFIKELQEIVHRHKNSYLHASWRLSQEWLKMINAQLSRQNSAMSLPKEAAESEKQLRHLLRQFQTTWKLRCKTHSAWFVPDAELRQSLKSKLQTYILPEFLECAAALNAHVESTGQVHWKRMFPLFWEEGMVRKQIELFMFEGL